MNVGDSVIRKADGAQMVVTAITADGVIAQHADGTDVLGSESAFRPVGQERDDTSADDLSTLVHAAAEASCESSNDAHISALSDALDEALRQLGRGDLSKLIFD